MTVSRYTGSAIRSNLRHGTAPNRQLSASHGIQLSSRLTATLSVRHGKKISELETWADHAIPLAACASAPIYVEETLLETIGKPIPQELRDAPEILIQALTTFVFQKDGAVSPGFQQAVQQARASARRLRTTYVGSEHLLLGLLTDISGPGVAQLQNHGIDPDQLQREIEDMLKGWQLRPSEFQRVIQAQWKVVTKLPVDGNIIHEGKPTSITKDQITIETVDGTRTLSVADLQGLGPKEDDTALLETAPSGHLHIHENGFGFLRPTADADTSPDDIYISQSQIQNFHLKHGDYLHVDIRPPRGDALNK